jgi:solute carrier family 4 (anion exchanger), member 2
MRRAIGDFGVPITIIVVVLFNTFAFSDAYLQKLRMPSEFSPTSPEKRGWWINPFGMHKAVPVWAVFAAFIPAFFVYILLFVEIGITEMILAQKERGLRKGNGYHWDMLLMGLLTLLSSLMGLPWMCSAAVQSLTHAASLTVMKPHAPGERPQVERVLEQRMTTLGVALLIGACAFLGFALQEIPLAVLFGVFLYLGIMNMLGVQFLHRLVLVIIPKKYHPDLSYCQGVMPKWMHLYTGIQLACLGIVWLSKSFSESALVFPFILMMMAVVRKYFLPILFNEKQLMAVRASTGVSERACV